MFCWAFWGIAVGEPITPFRSIDIEQWPSFAISCLEVAFGLLFISFLLRTVDESKIKRIIAWILVFVGFSLVVGGLVRILI